MAPSCDSSSSHQGRRAGSGPGWLTHLTLSLRHAPGGAKAPIRRKVAPKQPSAQDDKKLQTALKKLNVQGVGAVEEVNMFMDDGKVLNFNRPTGTSRLASVRNL